MRYFELFPVFMAVIAIFVSSKAFIVARRKSDKIRLMLSMIIAMIMIVAQTSWFTTSVILNKMEDTTFANYLWTIFNTLTMVLLILFPGPRIFNKKP